MKTVIYPPTLDFGWMFQRPQQIMRQFAKNGYRVIYCNATQRPGANPTMVEPNLEVHYDFERVKREFPNPDVLWVSWAKHNDVPIKAKVTVYDCLDDFPDWDKFEDAMISRSDIIFTTSQALYDKQKSRHNNITIVRNGCDPNIIGSRNYPKPTELRGMGKPIVGFVGALGQWVDTDLLNYVASNFNTIVIGPAFGKNAPSRVKYLGLKDYNVLPAYYNNIDVGIIPFLINRVSVAANPIKMYEYLSAGKPVVTTNIPECGLYPDVVFKSINHMDFIANIRKASQCCDPQLARNTAMNNSWAVRFNIIEEKINQVLESKK